MKTKKALCLIMVLALVSILFVGCDLVGSKFEQTWGGDGSITVTQLSDKVGFAFLSRVTLKLGTDSYVYSGVAGIQIQDRTITFTLPSETGIPEIANQSFVGSINGAMTRIRLCSASYKLAN